MTDVKISNLPLATLPLSGSELVPIVQGGVSKQVAVTNAGGGTVTVTSPDNSVSVAGSPGSTLALAVAATFNGAFNVLPGNFTYATLPAASGNTNKFAVTTDVGAVFSNGVYWQILYNPTTGTLAISSNSPLAPATQSVAYSLQLTATAGVGAQTWSLVQKTGTNSPLISSSGLVTFTPGTVETDYIVVQVSDSTGAVAQKTFALPTIAALTQAATPTFSPAAGTYSGAQSVTISCSTGSSTIYYTTNGSAPTTGSTVYTTPVTVGASGTLKAIATAAGFSQSAVGSAAYVINFNPIGVNLAAGGAAAFSYEGFPIFQDHTRSSRYGSFTQTMDAAGWPNTDFGIVLWEGAAGFSWATTGSPSLASASQTVATPGVFTTAAQAFTAGLPVTITGTPPGGFSTSTVYYVIAAGLTATTCQLSATSTGTGKQVTSSSACTIVPAPLFACGFVSKNGGAETITASNGTITNVQYGVVGATIKSFDFQPTNPATTFSYNVTGTTGGATNLFNWLPAYRMSNTTGYNATSLFTTEAISNYSNYAFIRFMHAQNTIPNEGVQLAFTASAAIGATSATLAAGYPYTGGSTTCILNSTPSSSPPDVRTITLTNGGTAISWTGALTIAASGITVPNSSQTRHTPANTKLHGLWVGGAGLSFEGYPAEWFVDFCITCNTNPYLNVPNNDDGTYRTAFATMVAGKLAPYPYLKAYFEIGNENWNGGYFAGTSCTYNALAIFNGFGAAKINQMGVWLHALAGALQTAFGSAYATQAQVVFAWQGGSVSSFYDLLTYYTSQGWVPSTDMKYLAVAPYFLTSNSSPTASIASSGVMTVTSVPFNNPIGIGSTITGTSVPASSTVTSQLSGPPTLTGTYQLSTSGTTVASEVMAAKMALTSSISQIQTNLVGTSANAPSKYVLDNMAVMALHYGLKQMTYEGGWETSGENTGLVNAGASAMDTGMTTVMNGYYNALFNHGVSLHAQFTSGVNGTPTTTPNLVPGDELSTIFPITTGTSPRFASIMNYSGGLPAPTFNVVSGVGSIIQGYNWADNTDTTILGSFGIGGFKVAPFFASSGYCPYLINCTNAKTYNIDVTFSGVSGSPTTDVWINGTQVASAVAVSNGVVRVVSASALALGANYILLGRSGTQTATITQIQTN